MILGSLPSERSIEAGEYYAHPRNAFWPIMGELIGATGSYRQRCQSLIDGRIALWDVLSQSVRPGSLDADIQLHTARANDFSAFLVAHPGIRRICFNGRKAGQLFSRFVQLDPGLGPFEYLPLPSTSPAHASMPFNEKLDCWRKTITLS